MIPLLEESLKNKLFSKNASKIAFWASENDLMSGIQILNGQNLQPPLNYGRIFTHLLLKQKYEVEVKQFYEYGRTAFLASRCYGEIGSLETSYSHIPRFNLAELARITYKRHKVGIGVPGIHITKL